MLHVHNESFQRLMCMAPESEVFGIDLRIQLSTSVQVEYMEIENQYLVQFVTDRKGDFWDLGTRRVFPAALLVIILRAFD